MEGSAKRMALAEAIQHQEKHLPITTCMYCGADMKIEPGPIRFLNMVVPNMPQHICHQCNDGLLSAFIGAAAEEIQLRHKFQGVVTMEQLLQAEKEDFLDG